MKKSITQFLPLLLFVIICFQACMMNPLELIRQEIGNAIEPMIPQLIEANKAKKKLTLAVVGFKEIHSGLPLNASDIIAEELATKLVPLPDFNIVEHRKISEIEAELVKQYGLIYDDKTTREVGKLVGADAILTGTIDVRTNSVNVYARIVDIEKGFVLSTATITINKIGFPKQTWLPKTLLQKPAQQVSESEEALPESLKFGITPYISNEKLEKIFLPILKHLKQETGIEMELVIVADYSKLAERMKTGDIDIGVFSPFAYVEGVKKADVQIFASQLINGRSSYQGFVITKKGNDIQKLSDLKNKSFAFVDPKSTSGYIYPRVMLIENGYNPATFFKSTIFAGSHDKALQSVLSGVCDAGAIYQDILEESDLTKIKVIAKTDKIPYDAYTVRKGFSKKAVTKIQKVLISLDKNTETGKSILTDQINGFIIGHDNNYDSVRKMASFRADRPNIAILNFREIGRYKSSMAEASCELLKNALLLKNNHNIVTQMESPTISALNASGNSYTMSEKLLKDLETENIKLAISGSVIHLGSKMNLSIKLHKIPSGAIDSAFTASGTPDSIEKMISKIVNEISDATPVIGYVITVDGKSFITDFGSDNGISQGDRILVFQDGKPLVNPLTGVLLGKEEEILAEGIVISTTPKVSVCKITAGEPGKVAFGKRSRVLRKNERPYFNN